MLVNSTSGKSKKLKSGDFFGFEENLKVKGYGYFGDIRVHSS